MDKNTTGLYIFMVNWKIWFTNNLLLAVYHQLLWHWCHSGCGHGPCSLWCTSGACHWTHWCDTQTHLHHRNKQVLSYWHCRICSGNPWTECRPAETEEEETHYHYAAQKCVTSHQLLCYQPSLVYPHTPVEVHRICSSSIPQRHWTHWPLREQNRRMAVWWPSMWTLHKELC